jgi:hypothetical protein
MHQLVEDVIWTVWPGFPDDEGAEAARERMAKADATDATLKIIFVWV